MSELQNIHGVYGAPSPALATVAAGAVQFSPLMPGSDALEAVTEASLAGFVMVAPPGTVERRYAMALALRGLAPGANLTVLALKDKGGSRLKAELQALGCTVWETSKRHHRICVASRPVEAALLEEPIAAGAPQLVEALGLWSQPGVFSWDRVDPGSALLARTLPPLAGVGADLGCGVGYLAREVLAAVKVTRMTLIDLDRRVIDAARRNITDLRAAILWADVRGLDLADLDFVVMNPPFHDGGTEDRNLGQAFIRAAAQALRKGGTCWLVANRHLPYEAELSQAFAKMTLKVEAEGYKVYEARK